MIKLIASDLDGTLLHNGTMRCCIGWQKWKIINVEPNELDEKLQKFETTAKSTVNYKLLTVNYKLLPHGAIR